MKNPFNNETVEESTPVTTEIVPSNRFADGGFDLTVDMNTRELQYCSMVASTPEEKVAMYNAMNNPEKRLADCINMVLNVRDIFIEIVNCTNEETGEITPAPRIVLVDVNGVAYQCVSLGIYNALKKVLQIFGEPTWKEGIPFEVKQITKGKRSLLTLNAVALSGKK